MGIYVSDGATISHTGVRNSGGASTRYLYNGATIAPVGLGAPAYTPLSTLITDPMSSDVASGFTVAESGSALSYGTTVVDYWNSGNYNTQGQLWTAFDAGNTNDGCKNLTTTYQTIISSVTYYISSMITVRTIVKNGDKFGLRFISGASMDFNIHIRPAGSSEPFKRATSVPVKGSSTGTRRLNVTCPSTGDWDVWCVASAYQINNSLASQTFRFIGVEHDTGVTLEKPANRKVLILDGDSWVHACGAGIPSTSNSYKAFGVADKIEELTGWVVCRMANGGTGWGATPDGGPFGIGDAPDTDYTTGKASVFGSYLRRGKAEQIIAQDGANIIGYVMHGSWNDGDKVTTQADMESRVSAFSNWLYATDPNLPLVCVGPEPYEDWPATDPTGNHNKHRLGQKAIMASAPNRSRATPNDGFIDVSDPAAPWMTGTGKENTSPTPAGTQYQYIGQDGIHLNYTGVNYWGAALMAALGDHQIPASRAAGAA